MAFGVGGRGQVINDMEHMTGDTGDLAPFMCKIFYIYFCCLKKYLFLSLVYRKISLSSAPFVVKIICTSILIL